MLGAGLRQRGQNQIAVADLDHGAVQLVARRRPREQEPVPALRRAVGRQLLEVPVLAMRHTALDQCSAHRQRPDRSNPTHSKVGLSVATTARTWSWNHSTLRTDGPPSPAAHFDLVAPSDHRAGDEIRGERRDHLQPLTPLTMPDHTLAV